MRDFKINTTIGVVPSSAITTKRPSVYITKGTTANISLNLQNRAFTFDQIEQCTFILKQPSGAFLVFELYDIDGNPDTLNTHFEHRWGPNYDYLNYKFQPEETLELEDTEGKTPIEFEVVIKIDGDNSRPEPYTFVEKQPMIATINSFYGELLKGETNGK